MSPTLEMPVLKVRSRSAKNGKSASAGSAGKVPPPSAKKVTRARDKVVKKRRRVKKAVAAILSGEKPSQIAGVASDVESMRERAATQEQIADVVRSGQMSAPDEMSDEEYIALLTVLVELARTQFLAYYHLFNPQGHSAFILGDLHRYLIDLVQNVHDGTAPPNTAVSVPPQHGKSSMLSVEAPSWILGVEPKAHVAITGFSHTLVTKFSKSIRSRMEHPLYQIVFPGVHPVRGSNKADEWVTTKGGGVVAKSAGSKLTGRRVDYLIMDDVHPGRAEAESTVLREKVVQWYFGDCFTRLHPKAKQFLIGTRWHPDDLIGRLTSPEYRAQLEAEGRSEMDFNYINIPAISEEGIEDPLGRGPDEALFPEERPLSYLKGVKASIPAYEWDSQYKGMPRSASSGVIDLSNLHYIKPSQIPWDDIDEIVRGWDTALSEQQTADYTAGALIGYNRKTKNVYILHMVRRRLAWAKMRSLITVQAETDLQGYPQGEEANNRVLRMGMEGVGGFKGVVEDVRDALLGRVKVELKNPPKRSEGGGSKLLRAQPWLNKIEGGKVYVVQDSWTKDFVDELDEFPDGKHDDQVDAVSVAHEMCEKRGRLLLA
jgi:predicted phage terminase large subunit-like protein